MANKEKSINTTKNPYREACSCGNDNFVTNYMGEKVCTNCSVVLEEVLFDYDEGYSEIAVTPEEKEQRRHNAIFKKDYVNEVKLKRPYGENHTVTNYRIDKVTYRAVQRQMAKNLMMRIDNDLPKSIEDIAMYVFENVLQEECYMKGRSIEIGAIASLEIANDIKKRKVTGNYYLKNLEDVCIATYMKSRTHMPESKTALSEEEKKHAEKVRLREAIRATKRLQEKMKEIILNNNVFKSYIEKLGLNTNYFNNNFEDLIMSGNSAAEVLGYNKDMNEAYKSKFMIKTRNLLTFLSRRKEISGNSNRGLISAALSIVNDYLLKNIVYAFPITQVNITEVTGTTETTLRSSKKLIQSIFEGHGDKLEKLLSYNELIKFKKKEKK